MGRFTTNGETHLPVHNEKHQTVDVYPCEETPDAVREKMPNPEGGAFTWSVRRPTYGPATLALKNHLVAMIGEFAGTTLFILFSLGGTNVANLASTSVNGVIADGQGDMPKAAPNTSSLMYMALCFGFSLGVNVWVFFRVSGGLFNPAVSFGMALVGALTPLRAVLLSVAQILGGITGCAILDAITPGTLNVRTTLAQGVSISRGLFIEMFMTAMLMLAILFLAAEKHKGTFLAPVGIGLAFFITELFSLYWTGGSLNPARSFGPDVVLRTFNGYHWIYWVGPCLGAALAAGFYKFIKFLEYETVLGPEDGSEATVSTAAAAAEPTTTMGALGNDGQKKEGHEMIVEGTGLGDLMTHNAPSNAFEQTNNTDTYYNQRLDAIEHLLSQLVAARTGSTVNVYAHSSMATLAEEEGRHVDKVVTPDSPLTHSVSHGNTSPSVRPAGFDHSPELGLGRQISAV